MPAKAGIHKSFENFCSLNVERVKKMNITVADDKLKEIMKTALLELLQEKKDIFEEVIKEVLEDMALLHAIREGEDSPLVSEEVIKFNEKTLCTL